MLIERALLYTFRVNQLFVLSFLSVDESTRSKTDLNQKDRFSCCTRAHMHTHTNTQNTQTFTLSMTVISGDVWALSPATL